MPVAFLAILIQTPSDRAWLSLSHPSHSAAERNESLARRSSGSTPAGYCRCRVACCQQNTRARQIPLVLVIVNDEDGAGREPQGRIRGTPLQPCADASEPPRAHHDDCRPTL